MGLHIFMVPFMAPSHQIPMLDMARLLASRGIKISILTTPLNLARFQAAIQADKLSGGHVIDLHVISFPSDAAGLPENCENFDSLPSRFMSNAFCKAIMMLLPQADDLVLKHRPDAIISDLYVPWTDEICRKYGIPRIGFHVSSCFSLCVTNNVIRYTMQEGSNLGSEPFLVPDLPSEVYVTNSQTPSRSFSKLDMQDFFMEVAKADQNTIGVVFNTFYEMEGEFIDHYKKTGQKEVWPVGPYLLYNKETLAMSERGKRTSIDKNKYLTWLDSKQPNSVIYVCFGSLYSFAGSQLVEIGLGLEASNCDFIWVIRDGLDVGPEIEALEERVRGRGLIIKGWAPQALFLDHPAVGGFMTHCGWNSVLEAVSFCVPMITWPLFGDQGYIETLVVDRLKMGFRISVDTIMEWGEEEKVGVLVNRERVRIAVAQLMGGGDLVEEMRRKVSELGELAESTVKEGGSSYENLNLLIKHLHDKKVERLESRENLN